MTFHLEENAERTQPTFPSVASKISCHMVQLSSVATRFSVNLCKCGLDPQGRDSLASTPAMDQQAFLCAPTGSVSTGKRQVLQLTCTVRTNSEKVTQDTQLPGSTKMPSTLNYLSPDVLCNWISPILNASRPRLAPSGVVASKDNIGICAYVSVRVCSFIVLTHSSPLWRM